MDALSLTGATGALVKLALDGVSFRQLVTTNNIANANTPGYAPLRVEFDDQLAAAARDLDARGAAASVRLTPTVSADPVPDAKVQIDMQVAQMSQDVLHYQALLRALRGQLDFLQAAMQ
jgi:flagellar basal-body rod protein FlgB